MKPSLTRFFIFVFLEQAFTNSSSNEVMMVMVGPVLLAVLQHVRSQHPSEASSTASLVSSDWSRGRTWFAGGCFNGVFLSFLPASQANTQVEWIESCRRRKLSWDKETYLVPPVCSNMPNTPLCMFWYLHEEGKKEKGDDEEMKKMRRGRRGRWRRWKWRRGSQNGLGRSWASTYCCQMLSASWHRQLVQVLSFCSSSHYRTDRASSLSNHCYHHRQVTSTSWRKIMMCTSH